MTKKQVAAVADAGETSAELVALRAEGDSLQAQIALLEAQAAVARGGADAAQLVAAEAEAAVEAKRAEEQAAIALARAQAEAARKAPSIAARQAATDGATALEAAKAGVLATRERFRDSLLDADFDAHEAAVVALRRSEIVADGLERRARSEEVIERNTDPIRVAEDQRKYAAHLERMRRDKESEAQTHAVYERAAMVERKNRLPTELRALATLLVSIPSQRPNDVEVWGPSLTRHHADAAHQFGKIKSAIRGVIPNRADAEIASLEEAFDNPRAFSQAAEALIKRGWADTHRMAEPSEPVASAVAPN